MKQDISITTDAVIFAEEKEGLYVLLIKRKNEPYQGQWALPGGFLEEDELLETGCLRELQEETGLKLDKVERVGVYDAIQRDPRGRTISVAFTTKLSKRKTIKGSDDAAEAKWMLLKEVEEIAFDHGQIIEESLEKLQMSL
ncbi:MULTISPECIES: NUDIX domain-containing protein [Mesonia]|uniref:Bifunctional NMN adenylyltransferase/Nudix hydrolase n=1 Tax=Mesonia oceanica TaxID=2687242 RepID=A0AC61YCF0_9FLAO|nr:MULTISPECIES: NUDIX hydrolase [Mesonia]MAN27185.1 NUDIX hydrolase [Mesonia sp.]MAQ42070.1 NUDIX hydrolase [Mesonia sp.]MBJ97573.1 NUDIX hydrolase [Flavobacteriaceae bacterium]VVV02176.1 Bifunctional NMN adenylyltransferase/Nudix hydrolase [Mesonia oceanica]|tara:strand:- start:124 stop:546 length:423 start_codon:yes stop_codon:yes gene_type:complete